MPPPTARRIALALMTNDMYWSVYCATGHVSRGVEVREDFGFTPAEIEQAKIDREVIARRYEKLKWEKMSFTRYTIMAQIEFLEGLDVGA